MACVFMGSDHNAARNPGAGRWSIPCKAGTGGLERPMRRSIAAAVVVAVLVGTSGCGSFVCRREAIRAVLRAPLTSGKDALSDELAGNFESDRDENPELEAVESAIEGQALSGRGVSMWLQRGLDHTLNLTLRLPTPLRSGDVLPVVGVHRRPGVLGDLPEPAGGTDRRPAPGRLRGHFGQRERACRGS